MKVEKTVEYYEIELNEDVLTEEAQEDLAQESDEENDKCRGKSMAFSEHVQEQRNFLSMKVLIVRTRLNR
ncbi:MAG: hypothetical protein ACRC7I_05655 [Selenomonadaceae bacterium]